MVTDRCPSQKAGTASAFHCSWSHRARSTDGGSWPRFDGGELLAKLDHHGVDLVAIQRLLGHMTVAM